MAEIPNIAEFTNTASQQGCSGSCDGCTGTDYSSQQSGDGGMVCFCYRRTYGELMALRAEHGSLKKVQELTNVGNGCGGCRVLLYSLFEEVPEDINSIDEKPVHGSSCVKPGQRIMTAFVAANGILESRIVSSNGVAPQLGSCDSTIPVEYALIDHNAMPVVRRSALVKTNETFCFDTRKEDLPRPFYGMFVLSLGRSNFGGARFNVQWIGNGSITSTHENFETGRPRIYLPFYFTKQFLSGPNDFYIALTNPHDWPLGVTISLFSKHNEPNMVAQAELGPYCTNWIDAKSVLLEPLFGACPDDRYAIKFEATGAGEKGSIVVNLFFYNHKTGHWGCQHL